MSPRKILAIKLRALGDTILMTAPVHELRRAFPDAEIHVVVTAPWAPLLEKDPAIQKIWKYEKHKDRGARAKAITRLAIKLRKEKFDCVVNFHASPSSSLLAFATGAKIRSVHFHGHNDKNRYSTVEIPGKGTLKPIIERDMDAIRAFGLNIPAGRLSKLIIPSEELEQTENLLQEMRVSSPILGLGLGASRPTKSWPLKHFAELALLWCTQEEGSIIALAGPGEEDRTGNFLAELDLLLQKESPERANSVWSRVRVKHELPIRELAALISKFSVLATNDSGPKHMAVAVGTPTVTFFGPEHPFEWHPYPTTEHPYLFIEPLECRCDAYPGMPAWCGLLACVQENHRCMQDIRPDRALIECTRVAR